MSCSSSSGDKANTRHRLVATVSSRETSYWCGPATTTTWWEPRPPVWSGSTWWSRWRPRAGCSTWRRSAPGVIRTAGCRNGSRSRGNREPSELSFRQALAVFAAQPRRFDLLRFLLEVLELLAEPTDSSDNLRPSWLVAACGAMRLEENLQGGVRKLAQLAGVSPGHLCHSMRRYYGTTATTFVADLRVRHAEMLLATTSVSVTDIARRSGFASLSYFSKSFHATQGVSPQNSGNRPPSGASLTVLTRPALGDVP